MEAFCRWVASHQKPVKTVLSIILGLGIGMLIVLYDLPYLLAFLLAIIGSSLLTYAVSFCGGRLQDRALRIMMDQCDPYPFLQELQTQLSYDYAPAQLGIMRLNLATALHNTGSTQVAVNVMKNLPIEQEKFATPLIKAMYYNNLASFLDYLEDTAGAEDAYARFLELAEGKARKVLKKHHPSLAPSAEAGHLYRLGDFAAALEMTRSTPCTTAYQNVEAALQRARCAIALGDLSAARQELRYVIDHGNKLAAVEIARKMLESMS